MDAKFFFWDISEVSGERTTGFFVVLINTSLTQFSNGHLTKPSAPAETNDILV